MVLPAALAVVVVLPAVEVLVAGRLQDSLVAAAVAAEVAALAVVTAEPKF